MACFAELLIGTGFATGVATYGDAYPGDEGNPRIVLFITLENAIIIPAIVDTGAPWCVLDPQLVRPIIAEDDDAYVPARELVIRGISYAGSLHRVRIGVRAEPVGDDLEVEATAFVPALPADEPWPHPNFLGLSGFLERIRFAVDPAESAFYFGPL